MSEKRAALISDLRDVAQRLEDGEDVDFYLAHLNPVDGKISEVRECAMTAIRPEFGALVGVFGATVAKFTEMIASRYAHGMPVN